MQESSVFEPSVVKRLLQAVLPYDECIKPKGRPAWLSKHVQPLPVAQDDPDFNGPRWTAPGSFSELWDLRSASILQHLSASTQTAQDRFAAEAVTYVSFLREFLASKQPAVQEKLSLIPILGPRFLPPTAGCHKLRGTVPTTEETEICPVYIAIADYHPALEILCPNAVSRQEHHAMSHQQWLPPRKVANLLGLDYVVGEQLRCKDCRNYDDRMQRAAKKLQKDEQKDIRDFLCGAEEGRYTYTVSTTSPDFQHYFKPSDLPCRLSTSLSKPY